jgi:hypothetical protein
MGADRRVKTSPRPYILLPTQPPKEEEKKHDFFFSSFYYCVQLAHYSSPSATVGGRLYTTQNV